MEVEFYVRPHERANGNVPTFEALETFEDDLKDYTMAQISKLDLRSKHSGLSIKKIEANLWSLRIFHKKTRVRIFFTYWKNREIVLLNGFIKKTKKTPLKELNIARSRMKEMKANADT